MPEGRGRDYMHTFLIRSLEWGGACPSGVASGAHPEFSPCRRTKQGPSVSPSCSSWVFTRCYYVPDSCFTTHEFKRVRGAQEPTAPVETVCRRRLRIRAGQYILLTESQRSGRNRTLTNNSQEKKSAKLKRAIIEKEVRSVVARGGGIG